VATETQTAVAHPTEAHEGHGPLHHHFDDMAQQRECTSLGMWLFLATEVMMFGGLFFAYSLYRWRFDAAFHAGSSHLDIRLGTINTFVLLFSSLTMAIAVHAAALGNKRILASFLAITWLMGLSFLVIKGFEWTADYREGLVPVLNWSYYTEHPLEPSLLKAGEDAHQVMMYFVLYFSMTGLHAIHMVVGLVLVGYFIWLSQRGQFMHGNDQPVEILGLYWHLVDIIWIFLFPLLYLIAGFHPFARGEH